MNIVLVITSMLPGGAERVMSNLANHWAEVSHTVNLITLDDKNTDFYKLNKNINRISLNQISHSNNLYSAILNNLKRLYALRTEISKISPDIVVSFTDSTNVLAAIALINSKIPLVVSERTDPTRSNIGKFRSIIRPFIYRYLCSCVVVQTNNVLQKCRVIWSKVNLEMISNPIGDSIDKCEISENGKTIISVGRLDNGKGFDILISAFARISDDFKDWNLQILGEGADRGSIEAFRDSLSLQNRVLMPGATTDIFNFYRNADIFCLASRYEGFPNALLEALAMGCACISTDCESGPREILEDGRLGILTPVDDVDAMAKALRSLMQSSELRHRYGSHAAYVRARYSLDKISKQWLDLFATVLK